MTPSQRVLLHRKRHPGRFAAIRPAQLARRRARQRESRIRANANAPAASVNPPTRRASGKFLPSAPDYGSI